MFTVSPNPLLMLTEVSASGAELGQLAGTKGQGFVQVLAELDGQSDGAQLLAGDPSADEDPNIALKTDPIEGEEGTSNADHLLENDVDAAKARVNGTETVPKQEIDVGPFDQEFVPTEHAPIEGYEPETPKHNVVSPIDPEPLNHRFDPAPETWKKPVAEPAALPRNEVKPLSEPMVYEKGKAQTGLEGKGRHTASTTQRDARDVPVLQSERKPGVEASKDRAVSDAKHVDPLGRLGAINVDQIVPVSAAAPYAVAPDFETSNNLEKRPSLQRVATAGEVVSQLRFGVLTSEKADGHLPATVKQFERASSVAFDESSSMGKLTTLEEIATVGKAESATRIGSGEKQPHSDQLVSYVQSQRPDQSTFVGQPKRPEQLVSKADLHPTGKRTADGKLLGSAHQTPAEKLSGPDQLGFDGKLSGSDQKGAIDRLPKADQPGAEVKLPRPDQPGVKDKLPKAEQTGVNDRRPKAEQPGVNYRRPKAEQPGVNDRRPKAEQPGVNYRRPKAEQTGANDIRRTEDQKGASDSLPRQEQLGLFGKPSEPRQPTVAASVPKPDQVTSIVPKPRKGVETGESAIRKVDVGGLRIGFENPEMADRLAHEQPHFAPRSKPVTPPQNARAVEGMANRVADDLSPRVMHDAIASGVLPSSFKKAAPELQADLKTVHAVPARPQSFAKQEQQPDFGVKQPLSGIRHAPKLHSDHPSYKASRVINTDSPVDAGIQSEARLAQSAKRLLPPTEQPLLETRGVDWQQRQLQHPLKADAEGGERMISPKVLDDGGSQPLVRSRPDLSDQSGGKQVLAPLLARAPAEIAKPDAQMGGWAHSSSPAAQAQLKVPGQKPLVPEPDAFTQKANQTLEEEPLVPRGLPNERRSNSIKRSVSFEPPVDTGHKVTSGNSNPMPVHPTDVPHLQTASTNPAKRPARGPTAEIPIAAPQYTRWRSRPQVQQESEPKEGGIPAPVASRNRTKIDRRFMPTDVHSSTGPAPEPAFRHAEPAIKVSQIASAPPKPQTTLPNPNAALFVAADAHEEAHHQLGPSFSDLDVDTASMVSPAAPSKHDHAVAPRDTAPSVARQVVEVMGHLKDGQVALRLAPEELGAVRLSMSVTDTGLALTIQSERAETQDLMRRNIDLLKDELADLGFVGVEISFGDGNAPSNGKDRDQSASQADPTVGFEANQAPGYEAFRTSNGVDLRI